MNLNFLDPERITGGALRNSHVKPRYRTKIASVSPPSNRFQFEDSDACFLGVSLENTHFTRPKFESMLAWITPRFRQCTILVGDSIHRITLESTRGLQPDQALKEGLSLGYNFIAENQDLVSAYSESTVFKFETCSSIQRTPNYLENYINISNYYAENAVFRESVENFSRHYHRRKWDTMDEEAQQRSVENSCRYFLEEFAIFSCLQRKNLDVMIYPGTFSTLEEVATGQHPGVCAELRALTIVSLQIKRR